MSWFRGQLFSDLAAGCTTQVEKYYGSWSTTNDVGSVTRAFRDSIIEENITPKGIVFNDTHGNFTIQNPGTYVMNVTLVTAIDVSNDMDISILLNNVIIHSASSYVHSSIDPVEHTINLILNLTTDDFLTVDMNKDTNITVTVKNGTTMSLHTI